MNYNSPQNFPLYLTLSRFVLGLTVFPFLVVYAASMNHWFITLCTSILFCVLSLTDFFDGYYARKYGAETLLGKLLDPLADKMLMIAMLIALLSVGYINYYAVIALISREIIISSLRAIALEYSISLDVIWLAKVKTFLFSLYGVSALWAPYHMVTILLLWCVIIASIVSGLWYAYTLFSRMPDSLVWFK